MTTRELLLTAWAPGGLVPVACVALAVGYGARFRQRVGLRSALFGLAVVFLFLALASPIGVLARGYLFSAHMLQHLLLTLVIPPLVLLGLPPTPDAAPPVTRRGSELFACWLAGVGAMWIWHAPTLCNAAATSPAVQTFQTVSLVVMGLAFWRPIVSPRQSERIAPLPAVGYLFAACIACTILGILVTLSPVAVCAAYLHPKDTLGLLPLVRDGWGLSCKADQEIGGLLMWVPTCFVYAAAILATLGRYYAGESAASSARGLG